RKPDDCVEGCPQLMGHIGEELALVTAGRLQLAALHFDLPKQARILDGQGRLSGKRAQEADDFRLAFSRRLAGDCQEPAGCHLRPALEPVHALTSGSRSEAVTGPNWFQRSRMDHDALMSASFILVRLVQSYAGMRSVASAPA